MKGIILAGGSGTRLYPATLAIAWPLMGEPAVQPTMADKDRCGKPLAAADTFA